MRHSPPPSKIILVLVAIAALAVVALVFLSHRADKGVAPAQVSETATLPPGTDWPSTKVKDQTIKDDGSYYSINAVYPVTKDDVISGYFSSFVNDSITQFKQDTSWAAGSGASAAPAEAGDLSLNVTYTEQKNSNADNYIFSADEYSGGAHDLVSTKTFSFSPTGQLITLDSLFTNGSDGLKTIAPYVASQLATAPDADASMITAGTAATEDNYQNFTVQSDGVTFLFDPYEVAPYSDGAQSVKVPVSVFASIASSDIFSPTQ